MSTHLRKVPSEAEQVAWMQEHGISTVADLQGGLRDPSSLALLPLYVATKSEVPAYLARAPYRAPGQRDAKRQKTTEAPPKVFPSGLICCDRNGIPVLMTLPTVKDFNAFSPRMGVINSPNRASMGDSN